MLWFVSVALIVAGIIGYFFSIQAAMGYDAATPAWCGYFAWGSLGSIAIGVLLGLYLIVTLFAYRLSH